MRSFNLTHDGPDLSTDGRLFSGGESVFSAFGIFLTSEPICSGLIYRAMGTSGPLSAMVVVNAGTQDSRLISSQFYLPYREWSDGWLTGARYVRNTREGWI